MAKKINKYSDYKNQQEELKAIKQLTNYCLINKIWLPMFIQNEKVYQLEGFELVTDLKAALKVLVYYYLNSQKFTDPLTNVVDLPIEFKIRKLLEYYGTLSIEDGNAYTIYNDQIVNTFSPKVVKITKNLLEELEQEAILRLKNAVDLTTVEKYIYNTESND